MRDPGRTAVAKDALRQELLLRRRARPEAERAAAAAAVAAALVAGLRGVGTLAAFVPDPTEPGAGRLPEAYADLGARVLLPVIPAQGRVLDWALHTGELESGRFGLTSPGARAWVARRSRRPTPSSFRRWRSTASGSGSAAVAATTTGPSSTPVPTPCWSPSSSTTSGSTRSRASRTTARCGRS